MVGPAPSSRPAPLLLLPVLVATALPAQDWRTASPAGTDRVAIAFDDLRARTIWFGGRCTDGPIADTWEHDGALWRQVTTTHFPGPRTLHALAFDSARGRVVLFGGMTPGSRQMLAETWEYDGSDWTQVTTAVQPTARTGHAMAFDAARNRTVLFAGYGQTFNTCFGDTWEYDGGQWRQFTVAAPPARHEHAMAYDRARGRTVLFGGISCSGPFLADTWEWNGSAWSARAAPGPNARYGQAMTFDDVRGRVVMHGGASALTLTDTWEFDGVSWTQSPGVGPVVSSSGMAYDRVHGETLLFARDGAGNTAIWHRPSVAPVWQPAATEYPAARWAAGLVYDWALARTVLHGGGPDLLADTWLFDGATWTRVTTAVAPPRAWYFGFAFDIVRARTVRFGGWDANNVDSASTWEFDGVTWTQRLPASSPPARHATAMAYDPGRQRVVLFGGSGNFTLMRNDTWEYDGSNWQQQQPATVPPSRQEHALAFDLVRGRTVLFGGARFGPNFDDTWEWDGRDWTRVLTVNAPAGRYAFAMAYDVLHQRTVLHGGSAASSQGLPITLDDTWAYDGRNWSQLVVANSPGGRMRHTMAHDLAHDTIVVFSGEERGDTWRLFPVAAACLRSGTGCAGSAGVPSLDAARGNLPILGNTFTLDLSGLPAQPGTALLAYGLGHSSWNGAPLPLSLASIGLPGCNLYLAPAALQLLAHAGAVAHALLTIPANASLAGLAVDAQGLSFDAAAPSGIGALSNAVVLAIR